ncbi:MAG: CBS domain-containing protein [Candidatus Yanofskybacteria bacterium]|nr:CBS domain-containing protein [Candidatus Yanofskybacteria bacterium]
MDTKQRLFVEDIMSKDPVAIGPEDLVVFAARLLFEKNFNGLPVVNEKKEIIGIVTEYDLISKGEALHLPTLINLLGNVDVYKKDSSLIRDDLKRLLILKVKDIMNKEPLTVRDTSPIQVAAELFAAHHKVNPIPVVDSDNKLVGVVSRFDLLRFFADYSVSKEVEADKPEVLDQKVESFINDFEKKFVLVSKGRARFWPIASLLFAIAGFVVAFAIILRIATK